MSELKVCRLCLRPVGRENFSAIENMRNMLDALQLNLNLEICKDSVVCGECTRNLQNCSYFKLAYVDDINVKSSYSQDHKLCRFCRKLDENRCLTDLYETKENVFLLEMMSKHMPEVNLSATEEILTCDVCLGLLNTMYSFILNCFNVEDKIKKYIEQEGTDDKGYIELNFIQERKPIINNGIICDNLREERDETFSYLSVTKTEIKIEDTEGECLEMKLKNEEIVIKTEQSDYDGYTTDTATISFKEETEDENQLNLKHCQCDFCPYRAKFKSRLKQHMLTHINTSKIVLHKCDSCPFVTKRKDTLRRHLQSHKSSSVVELHKCNLCPFVTKLKGNLKNHMLRHKDCSETEMYKCNVCSYATKRRSNLKKHMIIHKNCFETGLHKCEHCSYTTMRKANLKSHMLTHRNSSEVIMHKCKQCPYETKHKTAFVRHLQMHKDSSQETIYKCELCSYKTKINAYLKRHMMLHKSAKEATMYICEVCAYKTNIKRDLVRHLLRHKDDKEVKMFRCDSCTYQTGHKAGLKVHSRVHKDPSELKMFKCPFCPYEVRRESYLKKHMDKHK